MRGPRSTHLGLYTPNLYFYCEGITGSDLSCKFLRSGPLLLTRYIIIHTSQVGKRQGTYTFIICTVTLQTLEACRDRGLLTTCSVISDPLSIMCLMHAA